MISVAHLTDVIDNRTNSGTARVCREIITHLSNQPGIKQYLFHFENSNDNVYNLNEVQEVKIPLYKLPFGSKFFSFCKYFIFNNKQCFDVCHWHTFRVYPFFWLLRSNKTVITIHDEGVFKVFGWKYLYNKIFASTLILFRSKINFFIVDSIKSSNNMPVSIKETSNVVVIYPGSRFSQIEKKTIPGFNYTEDYILCVSRWQPLKNVETLVRSFLIVKNKFSEFSNLKLVLVGQPVGGHILPKKLIDESSYKGDFIILKNLEDSQMASLYDGARFAVLPSLFEGFGLPALESISRGCRILVDNESAPAEIVSNHLYEVDMRNEGALAHKISDLLREVTDKDMTLSLKERACEFTWEIYTKKLLKLYSC